MHSHPDRFNVHSSDKNNNIFYRPFPLQNVNRKQKSKESYLLSIEKKKKGNSTFVRVRYLVQHIHNHREVVLVVVPHEKRNREVILHKEMGRKKGQKRKRRKSIGPLCFRHRRPVWPKKTSGILPCYLNRGNIKTIMPRVFAFRTNRIDLKHHGTNY